MLRGDPGEFLQLSGESGGPEEETDLRAVQCKHEKVV